MWIHSYDNVLLCLWLSNRSNITLEFLDFSIETIFSFLFKFVDFRFEICFFPLATVCWFPFSIESGAYTKGTVVVCYVLLQCVMCCCSVLCVVVCILRENVQTNNIVKEWRSEGATARQPDNQTTNQTNNRNRQPQNGNEFMMYEWIIMRV